MATSSDNIGLVAEIESKLPVKIKKEIEGKSPQFLQLLTKVADKLDKSGRSQVSLLVRTLCQLNITSFDIQKTQRKLDGCREKTEISRRKFLDSSIKLETLNEVIFSKYLNTQFENT